MKNTLPILLFLTAPALVPASATAQGFSDGDMYLVSQALPLGTGFSQQGLMRISPFDGSAALVKSFQGVTRSVAYDPFRDRLAMNCTVNNQSGLYFVDSDGNATYGGLNNSQAFQIAASGDGRIYCLDAISRRLHVVDASGAISDLLDSSGSAPFALGGPVFNSSADDLYYDSGTNSLFFMQWTFATDCGWTSGTMPSIVKIPLAANGMQISGAVQTAPVCLPIAHPENGIDFNADSLSAGPGGKLFLTMDDNSNSQFCRMALIDPVTLVSSVYAQNGPYIGAAATNAGCYSKALGRGVILDTFANELRAFGFGETGMGVEFAQGVSSDTGSGDTAKLIEIHVNTTGTSLNVYGTGTPGCAGPHVIGATKAPIANVPGFRITCTNAPPSSLGLLLVGNVPDVFGSDPLYLGILTHVDLFNSTELYAFDLDSNPLGYGSSPTDLALSPAIVGNTYYAQALWYWTSCSPSSSGLSSSPGLAITVQ
ncbi:MAG: hypothetical protein HY286_01075 [Planctomycetes bacterium]|nr:hypothetical protein [Planctomycetota bacterium]